jgi:outer membrane protein assembly factor BamA
MQQVKSLFILFLFCQIAVFGQTTLLLEIKNNDNPMFFKNIRYKKTFNTSTEREKELQKVLFICFDNAYLTAQYDSTIKDSTTLTAHLQIGIQYKWANLKNGNINEGVLSEIGFREKLYNNRPVSYKDVKKIQERLIVYYENNGYPFASVKLSNIIINEDKITGELFLTKNSEHNIDSIVILGNAKISPTYIYNYIGIKPKSRYNEAQLKKINTRISELPFLRNSKPASVKFTEKYNVLTLYLEKKKASQFDGIIGILPDNQTGKILFTGDVRLKLQNGLGKGELIDLNWRRLQTQTQDLKLKFIYPFLFKTPFGVDYNFKLYKRDTTFIDVNQNIGLQYMFIGGNYFKVFYINKNATLLNTKGLENIQQLPNYAEVSVNMYGAGIKYEKLDYRLNPRKGFYILLNASAGKKTIKKNSNINPAVYENIKLVSTQYIGDFEGAVFIPFANRNTFKIGNQTGFVEGENTFQNELIRIGGLKTLRGFDEESIFTSRYSIATIEYRFLLEQNSYLFLFYDQAWYENRNVRNYVYDHPSGFGAGVSFETKAGIFSINYALGKQFDNPIQLRSGKIHFGLVNYF